MKKKMTVVALCAMLFAFNFPVEAQQVTKVPRIGYVVPPPLPISRRASRPSSRVCESLGT